MLGATVPEIIRLLCMDYMLLVLLATFIASPIAWYFLQHWLESFAYRAPVSWWLFLLSGAGAIAVALFTVSYQAVKAALANPTKSLRTQ